MTEKHRVSLRGYVALHQFHDLAQHAIGAISELLKLYPQHAKNRWTRIFTRREGSASARASLDAGATEWEIQMASLRTAVMCMGSAIPPKEMTRLYEVLEYPGPALLKECRAILLAHAI